MIPRIAVIGLGGWATAMHLPSMLRLQQEGLADYCGVCDLNPQSCENFSSQLNVQGFTDFKEMLKVVNPDGVAIFLPPDYAGEVVASIAGVGLPFMVEKPPAKSSSQHIELNALAGNVKHVVAYNRRFSVFLQSVLKNNNVDEIISVSCRFYRHRRFDSDFTSTLVHPLDTLQYLGGGKLQYAIMEKQSCGQVCNYYMQARTGSGVILQLEALPDSGLNLEEYCLHLKDKTIFLRYSASQNDLGRIKVVEDNKVVYEQTVAQLGYNLNEPYMYCGVYEENRSFVEIIKNNIKTASTLSDTLLTQQLREAFRRIEQVDKPHMVRIAGDELVLNII